MRHFLVAAAAATDVSGLWDLLIDYFDRQGIRQFICVLFASPGMEAQNWIRFCTATEAWVHYYYDNNLINCDPIRLHAASATHPFHWYELPKLRMLSPEEERFLVELRRFCPGGGFAVPVFGPNNRNGYVSIVLPESSPEIPADLLIEFRVVAQFAHQRFCDFARQGTPAMILSPREQEVLHWVARGKSNSVIADIIGVSSNTVDTHLRRIYAKLNVSDRVSAALAGIGYGYISLD